MRTELINRWLPKLRKICLGLDEVKEKTSWGNPTFFAKKKTFAVLDHYQGHPCLVVKPDSISRKSKLMKDCRFFDPPYVGKKGWVALKLDEGPVDWALVKELVLESYQQNIS